MGNLKSQRQKTAPSSRKSWGLRDARLIGRATVAGYTEWWKPSRLEISCLQLTTMIPGRPWITLEQQDMTRQDCTSRISTVYRDSTHYSYRLQHSSSELKSMLLQASSIVTVIYHPYLSIYYKAGWVMSASLILTRLHCRLSYMYYSNETCHVYTFRKFMDRIIFLKSLHF